MTSISPNYQNAEGAKTDSLKGNDCIVYNDFGKYFTRRLEIFGALAKKDKDLIQMLTRSASQMPPDTLIIREGDKPNDVILFLSGFAFRYKSLSEGRRHIVSFLIPGDISEMRVALVDAVDCSIATVTNAHVVKLRSNEISLLLERPAISRALQMVSLVDAATSRDWLANIGSRSAERRLAHFLCEWHARLKMLGLAPQDVCDFPFTQAHIADALGLSSVHTNRVMRALHDDGLIIIRSRRMIVPDTKRLRAFGEYCGEYICEPI